MRENSTQKRITHQKGDCWVSPWVDNKSKTKSIVSDARLLSRVIVLAPLEWKAPSISSPPLGIHVPSRYFHSSRNMALVRTATLGALSPRLEPQGFLSISTSVYMTFIISRGRSREQVTQRWLFKERIKEESRRKRRMYSLPSLSVILQMSLIAREAIYNPLVTASHYNVPQWLNLAI